MICIWELHKRCVKNISENHFQKLFHGPADIAAFFPVEVKVSTTKFVSQFVIHHIRVVNTFVNQRITDKRNAKTRTGDMIGCLLLVNDGTARITSLVTKLVQEFNMSAGVCVCMEDYSLLMHK